MLKSLFGGKKRKGKSVNDIRKTKKAVPKRPAEGQEADLDARIKARKAKNLRHGEIKAALAGASPIPRPDIAGAINAAKALSADSDLKANKAAIDRALRLNGSARVIDEAMTHPAWRYVAMAVIRGLLEEEGPDSQASAPESVKAGSQGTKKGHRTIGEPTDQP